MPFKLTGYCRMRSQDGKFKPRRRRMQNVLLYSAKWSHLNKDKRGEMRKGRRERFQKGSRERIEKRERVKKFEEKEGLRDPSLF